MKHKLFIFSIIIIASLGFTLIASGQSASMWYLSAGKLRPNVSSWGLQIPSLVGGTDVCVSVNTSGVFATTTCAAGGGITSLNGLTGATQTFSTTSETNIGLKITSSGTDHNFTPIWIGTLANARIASSTYWTSGVAIVNASSSNWDLAYGWGNHATAGYLSSSASSSFAWRANNLSDLNNTSTARTNLGLGSIALLNSIDISSNTNLGATHPIVLTGDTLSLSTASSSLWQTAYSWGDHSLAGYLTSYTEADPIWQASSTLYALLASPTFTGTVTLPTATLGGIMTSSKAIDITMADGGNDIPLTVTQNDTTNNPNAVTITTGVISGDGLFIDHNGSGIALNIDSESLSADIVNISAAVLTTGRVIDIPDANALTTGSILNLVSNSANSASWRNLVNIVNDNSAAVKTQVLYIQQDAAMRAVFIDQNANGVTFGIDSEATSANLIEADSQNTSGNLLQLSVNSANKFVVDYAGNASNTGMLTIGATSTFAGNVGIGTATPLYPLHIGNGGIVINRASAPYLAFSQTSEGILGQIRSIETEGNATIYFWDSTEAEIVTIGTKGTYSGNVGIATTSPAYTLDVYGTTSVKAFIMSTGASANYVLTSDANGIGTWQASSYTETDPKWTASSTNWAGWNTAYSDYLQWSGTSTGLVAATGRTSLGLGTMAVANTSDYLATGTAATTYFTIAGANASNTSWLADIYWTGTATNLVAATGRTSLGLGDSAVLASSTWFKVANNLSEGTAATMRTNLGLVIGTDVMAYAANNATTGSTMVGLWNGTPIAYNYGGTGTSTALANQYLWWGDGTGKLVQVASSTLAGAGAGVSSLNTLTGALTLFDSSDITWTASGTVGLIPTIPNNATTGVATLSSLSSIGTITTGTWSATAIANTKGGTGQDTSGWSGVPKISSGTWATSTTLIKKTITVNFDDATTTAGLNKKSSYNSDLSVPILAGCQTLSGTSTFGIWEGTGGFASSSSIVNSLTCGTTIATTTTFADSSIAAGNFIGFTLQTLTSCTSTRIFLVKTITP